jgi:polysaccharide export outer membrane protein
MTCAKYLLTAVLACSIAACGDGPRLGEGSEPLAVTKLTDLPPPTGTDVVAASTEYHIGPFDKLDVSVFNVPELSGKFQVDAAARISLPLAGTIEAAGMTPAELARAIDGRLRGTYVKDPQVTVNLDETTSQVYTVDGQVGQPGSYPALGNITLMRAVANAKGTSEFARLDDVVVFRSVNGKQLAALYSLTAIRRGVYADPKIYPNDIIVVGDSQARRKFQQFTQMFPLLTTPLVVGAERIH